VKGCEISRAKGKTFQKENFTGANVKPYGPYFRKFIKPFIIIGHDEHNHTSAQ
jgi:hypothetical protein